MSNFHAVLHKNGFYINMKDRELFYFDSRRHYVNITLLESEGVDIIRTFKGKGWVALLVARVTSPSLVLRILHPVSNKEKELGDGMRLRAFIAMSAMSGKDEGDEIGEYLCDIWDERDFASNSNAEITDEET
jgi:hypothetical protein